MRRLVAAVLLSLALAGPVVTVAASAGWLSATTSPTVEDQLGAAINGEHRRVCGESLHSRARLVWMARYRATDMVVNGYFAHVDPSTGKRVWDYLAKVGLTWRAGAEILVWNSYPDDLTAAAAFRALMDSTSHRAAIRSCAYDRFGVGNYKGINKRMFVVLFFD